MIERACGGFQRKPKGQCVEITDARRRDGYVEFAEEGASALRLNWLPDSPLSLFKPVGGAVIPDKDLTVNKKLHPWTLGNYLSVLKKTQLM